MKQRAKRLMALFMAGVFALSTCMTSGPYTVMATEAGTAGVTTPSEGTPTTPSEGSTSTPDNTTPSGTPEEGETTNPEPTTGAEEGNGNGTGNPEPSTEPENPGAQEPGDGGQEASYEYVVELPEQIGNVPWSSDKTNTDKVQIVYGTEEYEVKEKNVDNNIQKYVELPTLIEGQPEIKCDNYIFSEITVDKVNKKITIGTATPNAQFTEILGDNAIVVGSKEKEYTVGVNSAWKDYVTWTVEGNDISGVEIVTDKEDKTKATLTATGFSGNNKEVTVKAQIKVNDTLYNVEKTYAVTVNKKIPLINISTDPKEKGSWNDVVKVVVEADKGLAYKTITVTTNEQEDGKEVTVDKNGKATVEWNFTKNQGAVTFYAKYVGDDEYAEGNLNISYDTEKATQHFEIQQIKESITYGDDETEIAYIDSENSTDIANSENKEWEYKYDEIDNGTLAVRWNEENQRYGIYFTPSVTQDNKPVRMGAGKYSFKITRDNADYNTASVTFDVEIKKKQVGIIGTATAKTREYNGEKEVNVSAELNSADFLADDLIIGKTDEGADIKITDFNVSTIGYLPSPDAGEYKDIEYEEFKFPTGYVPNITNNYEINTARKTDATIEKHPLKVYVCTEGGKPIERQYTDYKNLEKAKDVWIEVEEKDFVAGESAKKLEGYVAPKLIINTAAVNKNKNIELNSTIDNAIIPDYTNAEATKNYKFVTDKVGSLILLPQKITDIKNILSVDNAKSKKVYQRTDNKEIYYGQISESENVNPKIAWKIDNQFNNNVTETSDLNAIYNAVEVRHQIDKSEEGASLYYSPKKNDETIYVRLKAREGNGVTQWCEMTLINDITAPETTISLNNALSAYEFGNVITFGLFSNKQVNAEISKIADRKDGKDGAGVKSWKYYKIDVRNNAQFTEENVRKEEFAEKIAKNEIENVSPSPSNEVIGATQSEVAGKTIVLGSDENDKEDGNFVVFVVTEDNVGNQAVYGSNGVVVEHVELKELTLDYTTDGKIIDQKSEQGPYYYYKDGVQYFNKDVNSVGIAATATEDTQDVYSGVNEIEVKICNNDNPDETKNNGNEWIKEIYDIPTETLEKLKNNYSCRTAQVTKDNEKSNDENKCVRYQVSATAKDFAGNEFKNENGNNTVTKTFVLDKLKPVVINTINKNKERDPDAHQTDKGIYYTNETITIETTITERFTDEENITLTLEKLNDAGEVESTVFSGKYETLKDTYKEFGILSLECTKVEGEDSNDAKRTITITIPNKSESTPEGIPEGIYSYKVNAEDYSKNTGDACTKFCIDTTAPDVKVTYTAKDENGNEKTVTEPINSENSNETAFTGDIKVVEKNFKPSDDNFKEKKVIYDNDSVKAYLITDDFGSTVQQDITKYSAIKRTTEDAKAGSSNTIDWLSELATDIHNKASWSGLNENDQAYHYTFRCTTEANYEFPDITITDLAGNPSEATGNAKITLDRTAPEGKIKVEGLISTNGKDTVWDRLLESLTFGLYGKDPVTATIRNRDEKTGGSGIAEKSYYLATDLMSRSALDALKDEQWTKYNGNITMPANRSYIVYEKVVDKAGNSAYYSSDRVIVDNQNPQPEVTITPTTPGWGKGVYSASDNPGFDVYVVDPAGSDGSCAGLAEINCTITDRTTGHSKPIPLRSYSATSAPEATFRTHVSIDPAEFYSNEVQVTVEAKDHSTNPATVESQVIKIDNKAPIVTFSFDKSDVHNGKYYNNDKTLTITVDERNFDESYKPQVTSTAGGGYSISGWSHNGEIHTATVTFSGDSDYTVTYDCYDLAGNKSNTEKLEEFTVDKTKPAIQVSYDNNNALNNNYYKDARTATITITEHNFNPGEVTVTTTAQLDGAPVAAPGVSGWSGSGDTHVATVSYSADADYTFTISATDLASNVSEPYVTDNFTVDQTKPTVEITNIEDHSANNGEVAPVVTLNDINFDSSKTVVHLTGANKGEVDTTGMYTSAATAKGQTLTFHNFAENMDDIYTLTAEATDKAGNVYSTSKMFSVNRDGSTYMYDSYTDELIKNGYTNDPKNLVVSEINVDTLTFQELTVTENGTLKTLEQDKDYEVQESGSEVSWKEYKYTINASNFEEEGDYNVSIYSEDRATNVTTNTSKSKDILFAVDKTSPVIALSNIEDGGRYKVESQKFTANVDDNMALDKVEYYVDGKLQQTFDASEVAAQSGSLELSVDSSSRFQKVSVKAYDKANNEATSADADVLVSASSWVQFYNNKPAFYGTIGGGVAVLVAAVAAGVHFSGAGAAAGTAGAAGAGGFFFLAGKKKKDEEETK